MEARSASVGYKELLGQPAPSTDAAVLTSLDNTVWCRQTFAQPKLSRKKQSTLCDDPFISPVNDHKAAAGKLSSVMPVSSMSMSALRTQAQVNPNVSRPCCRSCTDACW